MERSTVTGSALRHGEGNKGRRDSRVLSRSLPNREELPQPSIFTTSPRFRVSASPRRHLGFTLLELMIVITIVIILASIALPQYQRTIMHAREAVLRDDLYKMRTLLDQYAADKGKLPQSLDDLISERYMRELPVDPITGAKDWVPVPGEDPNSSSGDQGVIDVKSASPETSSEGTPYSEW